MKPIWNPAFELLETWWFRPTKKVGVGHFIVSSAFHPHFNPLKYHHRSSPSTFQTSVTKALVTKAADAFDISIWWNQDASCAHDAWKNGAWIFAILRCLLPSHGWLMFTDFFFKGTWLETLTYNLEKSDSNRCLEKVQKKYISQMVLEKWWFTMVESKKNNLNKIKVSWRDINHPFTQWYHRHTL